MNELVAKSHCEDNIIWTLERPTYGAAPDPCQPFDYHEYNIIVLLRSVSSLWCPDVTLRKGVIIKSNDAGHSKREMILMDFLATGNLNVSVVRFLCIIYRNFLFWDDKDSKILPPLLINSSRILQFDFAPTSSTNISGQKPLLQGVWSYACSSPVTTTQHASCSYPDS